MTTRPSRRRQADALSMRPVSFDSLEPRQLLSAAVAKVSTNALAASQSALIASTKPIINTLKKVSDSLKATALATDYTAISSFTKPNADVVNTIQPTRYA